MLWWTGSSWSRHVEDAADVGDRAVRVPPFDLAGLLGHQRRSVGQDRNRERVGELADLLYREGRRSRGEIGAAGGRRNVGNRRIGRIVRKRGHRRRAGRGRWGCRIAR
ncbi:hypothetical protein [Pseudomonas proteolytica]|uniref:hypothetical protein n=1 Tax=Pseudomonas proteolytica TaxID=219574 RepID=UPI0030D6D69C